MVRKLLLLTLFPLFGISQPGNNLCSNATTLTLGATSTNETTLNATASNLGLCSLVANSKEVWYKVNIGVTTARRIELMTCSQTSGFTPYMSVLEGACGSFTSGDCLVAYSSNRTSDCSSAYGSKSFAFTAQPSTDYYVAVYDYLGNTGDFDITLFDTPANDEVCSAASVTIGTPIQGTTFASNPDNVGSCNAEAHSDGVWYKVVGDGQTLIANLCNSSERYHSQISVFEATGNNCNTLTCVTTNSNYCLSSSIYMSQVNWSSTLNQDYYILVHGDKYGGQSSSYRGDFQLDVTTQITPSNDHCVNATTLTLGSSLTGQTTITALDENLALCSLVANSKEVWYKVNIGVTTARRIELMTCSQTSGFTPYMSVLEGACGSFTSGDCLVAYSSNRTSDCSSAYGSKSFAFTAQPSTDYYVAVYDYLGNTGDFDITLFDTPANDEVCSAASVTIGTPIQGTTFASNPDNVGSCNAEAHSDGVWYKVVGDGQTLIANLCNSSERYHSQISVFEATGNNCNTLTCVTTNSNYCLSSSIYMSQVNWSSTLNQDYYILVHGDKYGGQSSSYRGDFQLNVTTQITPSNDHCVNATTLTLGSSLTGQTTITALDENLALCSLVANSKEVWYKVNIGVTTARRIELMTCSQTSGFTPYMSVLEGACGSFTSGDCLVAYSSNRTSDCSSAYGSKSFAFTAQPSTDYYVAVYDYLGNTGDFDITLFDTPANDEVCSAASVTIGTPIQGTTFASNPDNVGSCNAEAHSDGVWYKVVGDGQTLIANLCNSSERYHSQISVFEATGNNCNTLTCVTTNSNYCLSSSIYMSQVNWSSTLNQDYYILVHGDKYGGQSSSYRGDFQLDVTTQVTPSNDHCVNAISISDGVPLLGSTTNATDDNVGSCSLSAGDYGVWYTFTSGVIPRSVEFSTCASNAVTTFDAFITVYKGDCQNLTCVNSYVNWGSCGAGLSGRTSTFTTEPNTTYFAVVNNYTGTTGDFQIEMTSSISNDDCASALDLTLGSTCSYQSGSNIGASNSAITPLPTCGNYNNGIDVWYKATVPASGRIMIHLDRTSSGAAQDKAMAAYTGSCGSLTQIACSINGSPDDGAYSPYMYLTGQSPGSVIYYRVFTQGNNGGSDFQICAYDPTPPVNEVCSDAVALTSSYVQYSNQYSIGDPTQTAPSCGGYTGVNDVWFTATVGPSGRIMIQVDNVSGSPVRNYAFSIYSGSCGGPLVEEVCKINGSPDDGVYSPYTYLTGLSAGQVLYVRVYSEGGLHGGDFKIKAYEPSPIPSNELCSNAIALTSSYVQYSNQYSIGDPTQTAPSCGGYTGVNDVWFTATVGPSGRIMIQMDNVSGSSVRNYAFSIYSGSCGGPLVEEVCKINGSPDDGVYSPYTYLTGLSAGQVLYVRVYSEGGLHGGDFKIKAYEPSPIPSNELCSNAIALTSSYVQYSNQYSIGDPTQTAPSCGGYTGVNDVWFTATVGPSGRIMIQMDNVSGSSVRNYAFSIYSGSCGGPLVEEVCKINGSPDDGVYSPYTYLTGLSAGQVLYVRVYSEGGLHGGDFKIKAYEPTPIPSNELCSNAISLTSSFVQYSNQFSFGDPTQTSPSCGSYSGVNDVWFTTTVGASGRVILEMDYVFGSPTRNFAFTIYSGTCGGPLLEEVCRINGSSVDYVYSPYGYLTGLTPGQVLYVRVYTENGIHGGDFLIKAFEPTPIPANELCSNATAIPLGLGVCSPLEFTGLYSEGDPSQTSPSCAGYPGVNDVWFALQMPASGNLTVDVGRVSGSPDHGMSIYSGVCGALVEEACASNGSNIDPIYSPGINISKPALANTTVYIRVWRNSNVHGAEFKICAYDPGYILHTWTGAVNSDWHNSGNWDVNGVPNAIGVAFIPSSAPNDPILTAGSTADVLSLEVENGASFTGLSASRINVNGDLLVNGSYDLTDGTTAFVGTIQGIYSSVFQTPVFGILELNSPDLSLYSNVVVMELVDPVGGVLDLNYRQLTLRSAALSQYAQIAKGAGSILGNGIKVERYFSSTEGWRQIGLPVSANLSRLQNWSVVFSGNPDPSIYWWDATDAGSGMAKGWIEATSSDNNAKAYASFVSTSNPVTNPVYVTGDYVNGDQNFTVYNTEDPSNNSNIGWNFIPNPYATNLNIRNLLDDYLATGSSEPSDYPLDYSGAHIWNGGDNATGQYVTLINGVVTGAPSFDALSPFSGFWVKMESTDGASEPFIIRDAHRDQVAIAYSSLKTSATNEIIRIYYNNGMGRIDDAALYLDKEATEQFNPRKDAYKLLNNSGGDGEVFFQIPRADRIENTVIKSINPDLSSDTISIGLLHNQPGIIGQIALNIDEYSADWGFALWDTKDNTLHNLRSAEFQFIQTENDINRFYLVYGNSMENIFENHDPELLIDAYVNKGRLFLFSSQLNVVDIQITDLAGRQVYNRENLSLYPAQLNIIDPQLNGGYVITIKSKNGIERNIKAIF